MRVAVLGASGKSGKIFIESALKAGYTITAGIHHTPLDIRHKNLTSVTCDTSNQAAVRSLIKDCDVIVSLIGHGRHSPNNLQTDAISHVISAMKELDIKRVISLTGTGVRYRNDQIPFVDRIVNGALLIIDPNRIRDGRDHAKLLENSDLDWTIIRVLKLQNAYPKPYRLNQHGPTKLTTSRYEVAAAILEVIDNKSFIKQAPIITRP